MKLREHWLTENRVPGVKHERKQCSKEGCKKSFVNNGVCVEHGATVKCCSQVRCPEKAVQGGVCVEHGASVKERKRCSEEGCKKFPVQGGVCVEGCPKHAARKGGICVEPGKNKSCSGEGLVDIVAIEKKPRSTIRLRRLTLTDNNSNDDYNGGVCVEHGEKKHCSQEGFAKDCKVSNVVAIKKRQRLTLKLRCPTVTDNPKP